MNLSSSPSGPGWWRPLGQSDRRALATFVVLPVLLFALPALLGHPAIVQDNLLQNFPLRVLSGQQIRSGHLPLYNLLSNSGTPLLGGMNSGSFFPTSLLFVFLPAIAAWVLNLIAVYVTATVGMYSLLRWHSLRPSAAFVGAMVFSFTGAMMDQMVHIAVIQGFALLPWMVLSQLILSRGLLGLGDHAGWRQHVRKAFPGVVGLAVLCGLGCLTGEPRAIAEMELLGLVVMVVELIVHPGVDRVTWRGRLSVVIANAVGATWGIGLAMVQLVVGWAFISQSERSGLNYWFFGSGSMPFPKSLMELVPDIFGGNGLAGTATFFGQYDLSELTGYVGVVAVTALVAFLVRRVRGGWTNADRPFVVYAVLAGVGLASAFGSNLWSGYLLHALPLFGSTRLQSRNIVLFDLGCSVLLAWWMHGLTEGRLTNHLRTTWRRWVIALPSMVVIVATVAMLVGPTATVEFLGVTSPGLRANLQDWPMALHLALALVLLYTLFRVRATEIRRWLLTLVAIDSLLFVLLCSTGFVQATVNPEPPAATAQAVLGTTGRVALVDPTQHTWSQILNLGGTNLNVFTGVHSVQGYGSLVQGQYSDITGTHPRFSLDPCQLAAGRFAQLRLSVVAISTWVMAHTAAANCATAMPNEGRLLRFFGSANEVATVRLGWNSPANASSVVFLRWISAKGTNSSPVVVHNGQVAEVPRTALGFSLSSDVPISPTTLTATMRNADKKPVTLDGAYESALGNGRWKFAGVVGSLSIFRATTVQPSLVIRASFRGAYAVSQHSANWGDEWVHVYSPSSFVMTRSVAFLPGWLATATNPATHRSVTLSVTQSDLIQRIAVPAGTWDIHFHYHAPHIEAGVVTSSASLGLLFLALWALRPRWRQPKGTKVFS